MTLLISSNMIENMIQTRSNLKGGYEDLIANGIKNAENL